MRTSSLYRHVSLSSVGEAKNSLDCNGVSLSFLSG